MGVGGCDYRIVLLPYTDKLQVCSTNVTFDIIRENKIERSQMLALMREVL
jgi:hypothetical protein